MGEVWAARDLAAPGKRYVAVKLTKHEGVEAAKVLWDEARIASLIQHPNVCPVHELGQADGTQYLVMDWCDGASLHDLLQDLPDHALPFPLAAKIAAQVAAGLHAAHELIDGDGQALGVVHRDVSPQNVLISSQGSVLVTDFGVAKAAGQAHRATETGEVKGKLSYMAPEQVKSKDVDRRADVFALGCLLYLSTTGKRPFHGDDALATLYQILEKDVEPPSKLRAEYPPGLESIVLRALAKDREHRFQTAEELQVALERWLVQVGGRVTELDIAGVLMARLGDKIRERKALVSERDREAELLASSDDVDTLRGQEERPRDRESSSFSSAIVTRNTPLMPGPDAGARRAPGGVVWGALGLAVAVALGAVVVWRTSGPAVAGDAAGRSGTGPNVTPASPAPEPSKPVPVTVRIAVQPPEAELLLDGAVVGVGTYEATLDPSQEPRLLEARLAGHRTLSRKLVFDRNQDVHLELVRAEPAGTAQSSPTPPVAKPKVAQPAPTPSAQPSPPAVGTPLPTQKPKKPRPIDSTNPFESPR
jgi:serine/threonine-protein kinase